MTNESRNQLLDLVADAFENSPKFKSSFSPNTVDFSAYADVASAVFDETGVAYEQNYTKKLDDGSTKTTYVQGFKAIFGEYSIDWSTSVNGDRLVLYKNSDSPNAMLNSLSNKLLLRLAKK